MMKNVAIFLLLAIIAGGVWFYLKNSGKDVYKKEEATQTPQPSGQERKLPAGFSTKGLKEKELDLNNDGTKELLLTSLDASGPHAVLVDPKDSSKAFSNIFNFPQSGFKEEFSFKSGEAPEIDQTMDLNANGRAELVFDLKDYGAYTTTYGVVIFSAGKFDWLMLEEKDSKNRPAIFRDGASVRNADVFKILPTEKALVEVSGAGDNDGNWMWETSAYKWNGTKYVYDASLSAKIQAEQPKKIVNGQPVF
ncbi:hypothetical protein A3F23_03625 [Candidatus Giovannonibacteria bacterium RIFCSPHIGHO2_12_FULL_43_15]|uniref:Uncharacterized protein n=1 Tax=Candidatus Giovannonibacteria bacterium RIFCSPHIGHO2_12_FULL_43_15 TaxID=1798341 RepID=A0A1F5WQ55_9BACT|nr:MAG: hypothetical protein A3B97_03840 [Candidatus Giovannonibacteria bacterium RIFCSPHIGHO2_02_FULL_43_32]OGF77391.1 MAG: hypothetical protein A3F23_03625 [Candidatus Giovannonibacteria bacterium RIFCSPHIGHO2_12_FULL_43_15]OGF78417.1 MAG: hypothetical protein A3A15_03415 [Candidatus Giovannonibacteria bacterium RIFCSPLOWO2_01_FULL_43_60]